MSSIQFDVDDRRSILSLIKVLKIVIILVVTFNHRTTSCKIAIILVVTFNRRTTQEKKVFRVAETTCAVAFPSRFAVRQEDPILAIIMIH